MFAKELDYIQNPQIRNIAEMGLAMVPEYFYIIPASSSGKYHPQYALGNGGLYRHVVAACMIAVELFRLEQIKLSKTEKDLVIASLILHDGWKNGFDANGHTAFLHPLIAANQLWHGLRKRMKTFKEKYYLFQICLNIASHMGQWNTEKYSLNKLPKPFTKMQKFVHLCDYLASRKMLEVNFEVGER